MIQQPVFPFSALVGQELMKKALILNAINPKIGGVLIRGEKGTAKSTAVRAFARLLPAIEVVADCPFSCDPSGAHLCPTCAERQAAGETLATASRPVRVVELPVSATEDRVVGSLNLERAIKEGERAFEPGLLASANRGILYVDEVNLLNDHLVDVLLDAAAMEQNYVEREGVSLAHPAQFILVGTMNPEEGDLRPQLLDRFGLAVEVTGIDDPSARAEVVRRRIAFESDPGGFISRWQQQEEQERERIARAQRTLGLVVLSEHMLEVIARLCASYQVDGLRGDIVVYKTALALAASAGRREVTLQDVREAAELALRHRRRRSPLDNLSQSRENLDQVFQQLADEMDRPSPTESPDSFDNDDGETSPAGAEQVFAPDNTPVRLPDPPPTPTWRMQRRRDTLRGRRTGAQGEGAHGHFVRARPAAGEGLTWGNLALDATLRAAAPHQLLRHRQQPGRPLLLIRKSDLHAKLRESKVANLLLFLVDASGSMAARQRMSAVKGAVVSLLTDAYQKRDRVGLIAFRGARAQQLLAPTNSVDLAERELRALPTGGRTPLAHALYFAAEVIDRQQHADAVLTPWLVLLSDGRCNVPLQTDDPFADALTAAAHLKERRVYSLVIGSEAARYRMGLSERLANALGGRHLYLEELDGGSIAATVRREIKARSLS